MSNLLNKASILTTATGYGDGVVNSILPNTADGDFDFIRNSPATRVNSEGLIEDVPYNSVSYSEDFTDSSWDKSDNATATLSNVSFPNGELTPFLVDLSGTSGTSSSGSRLFKYTTFKTGVQLTLSFYARSVSGTGTFPYAYYSSSVSTYKKYYAALTEEWKRYTFTFTSDFNNFPFGFTRRGDTHTETLTSAYITGVQIVKGDQPKDYLKTTDRLNIPRIDYTDGCGSLLLEPSRENLITYSEDLSQWFLVNGTLTANATVSPEGIQNAGKVAFSSVGLDLKRTITVVPGQTYTFSFYIKVEEGTDLQGRFYDNNNSANIEYYNYDDQIIPNQWSRITRSVTAPSGCTEMQIWLLASSTTLVTASWWGAQFEEGSYATSYIPTSGSTVVREADVCNNAGNSDLINSEEGVLYFEGSWIQKSGGTNRRIALSDGTATNRILIQNVNSAENRLQFYALNSSGTSTDFTFTLSDITDNNKIAFKYKENNFCVFINGIKVLTDTVGTTFSVGTLNTLAFDGGDGGFDFYGKVKGLAVFKEALSDSELASLTSI